MPDTHDTFTGFQYLYRIGLRLDKSICTDLPDLKQELKLFDLVKIFQIHYYIKTCQKYKNGNCRFHYGSFFTDKTIIAERLPDEIPTIAKLTTLEK